MAALQRSPDPWIRSAMNSSPVASPRALPWGATSRRRNVSVAVKLKSPHNTYMSASEFARRDTEIFTLEGRTAPADGSIIQTARPSTDSGASTGGGTQHSGSGVVGDRSSGGKGRGGTPGSAKRSSKAGLQQRPMTFSMEHVPDPLRPITPKIGRSAPTSSGKKAVQETGGYRYTSPATLTPQSSSGKDGSGGKGRVAVDGVHEVFDMVQNEDDGTVSFYSAFGTWLSAQPEVGSLLCQSPRQGEWERFILLQYRTPRASPHYSLRTCHGTFVSFSLDGAVRHITRLLPDACIFQLEISPRAPAGMKMTCRCQRSPLPQQSAKSRQTIWRSRWRNKRPRVLVVLREHYDGQRIAESSGNYYHHQQRTKYDADPFTYRVDCPVEEFLDHFKRFVVDPLHSIGSMVHIFIGCGDRPVSNFYSNGGGGDGRQDGSHLVGLWEACRAMFGTAVVGYFDPSATERRQEMLLRPTGAAFSSPSSPFALPALPWGRVLELVKQVDASRLVAYDVMVMSRTDVVWQAPINEWGSDPRHINFLFREPPASSSSSAAAAAAASSPASAAEKISASTSVSDACHIVPRTMLPHFISALKAVHKIERQRASAAAYADGADNWGGGGGGVADLSQVGTHDLYREMRRIVGGSAVHGGGGAVRVCFDGDGHGSSASSSKWQQPPAPREGVDCWPSREVSTDDAPWVRPNPLYSFGEHRPMCHRGGAGHHVTLGFVGGGAGGGQ